LAGVAGMVEEVAFAVVMVCVLCGEGSVALGSRYRPILEEEQQVLVLRLCYSRGSAIAVDARAGYARA